jgi:hypothetical protein
MQQKGNQSPDFVDCQLILLPNLSTRNPACLICGRCTRCSSLSRAPNVPGAPSARVGDAPHDNNLQQDLDTKLFALPSFRLCVMSCLFHELTWTIHSLSWYMELVATGQYLLLQSVKGPGCN